MNPIYFLFPSISLSLSWFFFTSIFDHHHHCRCQLFIAKQKIHFISTRHDHLVEITTITIMDNKQTKQKNPFFVDSLYIHSFIHSSIVFSPKVFFFVVVVGHLSRQNCCIKKYSSLRLILVNNNNKNLQTLSIIHSFDLN